MKRLFLILYLFFSMHIFAQNKSEINFLAMDLHSDYYKETTYPKEVFKNYVNSDSLFSKFPNIVRSFNFSPNKNLEDVCNECKIRVSRLEESFKKQNKNQDLNSFWKTHLKTCYAKFIQTSPEIRFAFELQNNNATYHINEVSVYVYHTKIHLSVDKDFFINKKDEREKLIIDLSKTNQLQNLRLDQSHAIKDGGLALNLRFFSSTHWNGSFEKVKTLIHINFKFTNGQTIKSEPFLIEM